MSREHVLPRWLRDAVEVGDQPGTHILGIDQERVREWQALPFTTQSRRVCLSCNTGWMARLEDDTRPILGPLIGGPIDTVLSVDQQAVATSWALKTAMCVQLISPREWWPIPQRHFAQLYESRDGRLPLPGFYAWLGRYRASRPQTRHLIQPLQIDAETKGLAHPPDAYAASFAVGEMAIQVVGRFSPTTDLTLNMGTAWSRSTVKIWPTTGGAYWPPPEAIDEAVWGDFAQFGAAAA
jgi:hypothetical protein